MYMANRIKALLGIFLLLCSSSVLATTIGDVATNLMGPTAIVTKLVIVACYVIGIVLVFVAIAQFKIHKQSPKLVPLSTPIALLILGTVALLIPYATNNICVTGDATKGAETKKNTLLPLPGEAQLPGLPQPKRNEAPEPKRAAPPPSKPVAPPPPPSSGGWTSDPRYNR
jgi:hypothetical protein